MNDIRKKSTGKNILDIPIFRSVWGKAIAGAAALVMFCTVYALILPAAAITGTEATEESGFYLENEENSSEQKSVSVEDIQSDTTDITEVARIAESEASQSEPEDDTQPGAGVEAQIASAEPTDPEATEIILPEAEKNPEQSSTETTDSEINENENKDTEKTVKGGAEETAESAEEEKLQPGEASVDPVDSETSEEEPTEASEDEEIKGDDPEEEIAEEEEISEETEEAEVFEDGQLIFEGEDYKVTLDYSADARIPSNSHLDVREILDGDDYDEYLKTAADAVNKKTSEVRARLFDITILSEDEDGETKEIQPQDAVRVSIKYDEAVQIPEDAEMQTVHIPDEGESSTLDTEVETVENTDTEIEAVAFETESFSVFVVMYTVDLYIEADGETYKISVTYDENAGIPDGAELKVKEITKQDEKYEDYLAAAIEAAGGVYLPQEENETAEEGTEADGFARFFDIEIWANEQKVEPKADVSVSISLADAYAETLNELKVVHFEAGEEKPVVLESHIGTNDAVEFDTGSFSVYGVITEPEANPVSTDLEGMTFTLRHSANNQTYYMTSNLIYGGGADKLAATQNANEAAVWYFEAVDEEQSLYNIYTMMDDHTKRYLTITRRNDNNGNAGLSETPQAFTVQEIENGNSYVFSTQSNGRTYYLNHYSNEGGFAGWAYRDSNMDVMALSFSHPVNHYAIVIHHTDGNYYVVENDGTLTLIPEEDVELNGDGSVKAVSMINPVFWGYEFINWGNYTIWHDTDARTYDPTTGLPTAYTRRYLSADMPAGYSYVEDGHTVTSEGGYADLNDTTNPWSLNDRNLSPDDGHFVNIGYNSGTHHLNHYDHYLGVTEDENGVLRIVGQVSEGQAAEVYFAEAQEVENVSIRNHTVNHIDIAVEASAGINLPLAYGTYRLAELDVDGQETGVWGDPLVVTKQNEVTLQVEQSVGLGVEDLKKADITAYTLENGVRANKDNMYEVTGYSENATSYDNKIPQIRLEGSFKVADLEPVPAGTDVNDPDICQDRLDNRIYYDVSLTKPTTFRMTYTDPATNKQYAVYKEVEGDWKPFEVSVDVTLSASFDFWDTSNACPGVRAIYPYAEWQKGKIPDNGSWNHQTGLDGGPGMDFELGAPTDDTRHDIVAIEVTKYVQGDFVDGNEVETRTLTLQSGTDCSIGVYQNHSQTKLHDKTLTVGTDGIGMMYDYDVVAGTYDNAAYAQISEDPDSVADVLIDSAGHRWIYNRSYVETEYAWRNDGQTHPSRTTKDGYSKPSSGPFFSDAEVLGEYYVQGGIPYDYQGQHYDGVHEYNRFLEFYVYNIYQRAGYLKINKKVTFNGHAPANDDEKKALKGTYEFTVYTDEDCENPYMVDREEPDPDTGATQEPLKLTIEIEEDGAAKDSNNIVELPVGTYWIKETKPENGTLPVDEHGIVFDGVVEIEVTEESTEEDPVTAQFTNDCTNTGITVRKLWQNADGSPDNTKTGNITFTLIQTAYTYSMDGDQIVLEEIVENSETAYTGNYILEIGSGGTGEKDNEPEITFLSTQTVSITGLPKFGLNDGQKVTYVYSVRETPVDGYTGVETEDGNGNWTITNRPAANTDKDTDLTVTKLWKNASGAAAVLDGTENIQFVIHQRIVNTGYVPVTILLYDPNNPNAVAEKMIFVKKGMTFNYQMRVETLFSWIHHYVNERINGGNQIPLEGNTITGTLQIDEPTSITEAIQSNGFSRYGQWASNPWDQGNTGIYEWTFDYSHYTSDQNYKESIDDLIDLYEDTTSGDNVNFKTYKYDMVINNSTPETDPVGEVTTANFVAHFTKLPLFKKVGDDYFAYYYTVDEIKVNGKDVETDDTIGQHTDDYFVNVDPESNTITNTERPGALKVTKVMTINGRPTTIEDADGTYTFKIYEADGSTPAKKKDRTTSVEDQMIEIKDGVIWKVNGVEVDANHRFALVDDLIPGDYVIKEVAQEGSTLTGITGGKSGTADISKRRVTVTVKAGDSIAEDAAAVTFTNDKSVVMDINILKVDSTDGHEPLTGAKFILKKYDEGYHEVVKSWPETEVSSEEGKEGTLVLEDLDPGLYELEETVSPEGYVKISSNPRFTVRVNDEDGTLLIIFTDTEMVKYNSSTQTFTFYNEPGAALPSAGGPGTKLFTILGGMLILIAGAFLFQRRRLI